MGWRFGYIELNFCLTCAEIINQRLFLMKKVLSAAAFLFLLGFSASGLKAQKVYKVDYESRADVKVFVVDYESRADLCVYKVDYESRANGNDGKWFFVDYESRADKSIFFVDYESRADVKIYYVDYESRAGWKSKSKSHLFE